MVKVSFSNSRNLKKFHYVFIVNEASYFKFGMQLGFAKDHHKTPPRRKSGHGPRLGERPKIRRFLFNIYTMAEASDFKCGMQLGFAKAYGIITFTKSGRVCRFGKLPKLGVPFNICAIAEASEFTFGTQVGFAHRKIPPREKSA